MTTPAQQQVPDDEVARELANILQGDDKPSVAVSAQPDEEAEPELVIEERKHGVTVPGGEDDPVPPDNTFERAGPADSMFQWFIADDDEEKIEVTPEEKEIYWRDGVLGGERVVWDVPSGPSSVRMRCMNAYEYDLVAHAIARWLRLAPDSGVSEMAGRVQGLSVMLMLLKIGATLFDPMKCTGVPSTDVKELEKRFDEDWNSWPVPRMQVVMRACRVFTKKMGVCKTNLSNLGFWNPANAG
jgi:hypothetical protein